MSEKLTIIRGTDQDIELEFVKEDGSALDLTGYTLFFTMNLKSNLPQANDDSAVIKKTFNPTVPSSGLAVIVLSSTDLTLPPATYVCDIQLKNGAGKIARTQQFEIILVQSVTRRTS